MPFNLEVDIPAVFEPALGRARYIGAFGGRGSAKSHFFAGKLIARAMEQPGLHWLCFREVQKSLAQSSKRLLETKIQQFGLGSEFEILKSEIRTPGGFDPMTGKWKQPGLLIFQGMQNHTAESIKSLEGYDGAWGEESQTISALSLRLLRPTLRKKEQLLDGSFRESEIWFSWNPRSPDDPVDDFFRGNSLRSREAGWQPHPKAIVVKSNYYDNPFFAETALVEEMEYDRGRDADNFRHVWLGEYRTQSSAQVFKNWREEEFDTPHSVKFYYGADWGLINDPTVLVRCFIVGRTLYIDREIWALGCGIDRRAMLFDKIDPDWTPQRAVDPTWKSCARRAHIVADSASPDSSHYMRRTGFNISPAKKGPGSVEEGVAFLQSFDIIAHPRCKRTINELTRYAYKVDPKTDEVTSELADKDNHVIDSIRYSLENIRHGGFSQTELRI